MHDLASGKNLNEKESEMEDVDNESIMVWLKNCLKNSFHLFSGKMKSLFKCIPVFNPSSSLMIFWNITQILTIVNFFFFIPIHISESMNQPITLSTMMGRTLN